MADTTLVIASNRLYDDSFLRGNVSGVALDAILLETFFLPTGFGQLETKFLSVQLSTFSGAYVAPAPAYDGVEVYVLSADLSTRVDGIGSCRWVHSGTSSARPILTASFDLQNRVLVRQADRLVVTAPVLAGAGVTGVLQITTRGRRFQTQ